MTVSLKNVVHFLVASAVACYGAAIGPANFDDNVAKGLRLIETAEGVAPVWMTRQEKFQLLKDNKNFFDVTNTYDPADLPSAANNFQGARRPKPAAPPVAYAAPSKQDLVTPLISKISVDNMQLFLSNLTAFHNRYFESETGVAASLWIRDTAAQFGEAFPESKLEVSLFEHDFNQSSIIARFPGNDPNAPVTILGAHMDSINLDDVNGRAPGADDDGSGSVNLLEALRVLTESGFQPESPVEFQWYAAEEVGLLGSQDIAKAYNDTGVQVKAMLQLDMTAFVKPGSEEVIALMPDFTNENLTNFVGSLIDTYSTLNFTINNPCGFACSDHASWDRFGYPTALPFESIFPDDANEIIHTSGDTEDVEGFSWSHTLEYTKLAVAFAFELAA
ncbi:hypothetical protein NMY22_g13144 [Coprinellus aureogranulatus]|nr:hypothetical protein NMY22_g13144 [Coprinellus aureogranulatus]